MPRQLDALTPAAIKAAVQAVFPEDGHAEVHHVLWYTAEQLGSGSSEVPPGWQGERVKERYIGRVKRALDSLAEDGALIRVGARDQPPDGTSPGTVSWWTPEAYEQAKARLGERRRQEGDYDKRMHDIEERLAAGGFANGTDLTPDEWERILGMAKL